MLAEIITFTGIVCAGVLTQGEAGRELSQCIVGSRFTPGASTRNHSHQGLLRCRAPVAELTTSVALFLWLFKVPGFKAFTCWCL